MSSDAKEDTSPGAHSQQQPTCALPPPSEDEATFVKQVCQNEAHHHQQTNYQQIHHHQQNHHHNHSQHLAIHYKEPGDPSDYESADSVFRSEHPSCRVMPLFCCPNEAAAALPPRQQLAHQQQTPSPNSLRFSLRWESEEGTTSALPPEDESNGLTRAHRERIGGGGGEESGSRGTVFNGSERLASLPPPPTHLLTVGNPLSTTTHQTTTKTRQWEEDKDIHLDRSPSSPSSGVSSVKPTSIVAASTQAVPDQFFLFLPAEDEG